MGFVKVIPKENWSEHPILSRLGYKSDFDGDGTLHLKDFDMEELETCQAITIEVSEDGGNTWKSASFDNDITYIDSIGAGWYWHATSHPFDELRPEKIGRSQAIWRALVSD